MASKKITFTNPQGHTLSARLDLPVNQKPHTCALFAHCFTCSKNLNAVRSISRAMNLNGIAVLRFDFTGLGQSEGNFADTNFSSNVEDLIAAANYMEEELDAPSIIIGHSLGGAAVICAANQLPSIQAVVTIGAPYDPEHVSHLLSGKIETIEDEGVAEVIIGGRPFNVKRQFLEDIREKELEQNLRNLNRALLILHSPQDLTVAIENAANLYQAARHPKSFISLDGADHLLSEKEDAEYTGEMIASWSKRYINRPKQEKLESDRQVAVRLPQEDGFTSQVMVRKHGLTADEPTEVGGNDFGPSPYEFLNVGLGACTAMTLQMYARRKKWPLDEVVVHLDHGKKHVEDCENLDDPKSKIDHFDRTLELKGDLSAEQKDRLMEIADKCPVHKTLHNPIRINTSLME
jgi:uncharacterized OsmC-like protein/alpha/beta superfamily hydrolase